jgi:hypothetical protein
MYTACPSSKRPIWAICFRRYRAWRRDPPRHSPDEFHNAGIDDGKAALEVSIASSIRILISRADRLRPNPGQRYTRHPIGAPSPNLGELRRFHHKEQIVVGNWERFSARWAMC